MYSSQVTLKDAGGYDFTLDADKVMSDNVTLQHEHQVGYSSLWILGNEFGPLCAVWAPHDQGALDAAVDADLLDSLLIPEADIDAYHDDEVVRAGNASEPFASAYLWIKSAPMCDQSRMVVAWFAECRGAAVDTLGAL